MKDSTKSSDAHECDHQFGENSNIAIGMSQIQQNEDDVWLNIVSAMTPHSPKLIQNVLMSRQSESPDIDLHIAENAFRIVLLTPG
jgi:hypothetical protein